MRAYKLSFLAVPLAMLAVGLLLAFRRGHSFYDHAAFAEPDGVPGVMRGATGGGRGAIAKHAEPIALLIHGSAHFRGAYRLSWIGAIVRAGLLTAFAMVTFGLFFYTANYVAMLI